VAGSCEQGNDSLGSIRGGELLGRLFEYHQQLLKELSMKSEHYLKATKTETRLGNLRLSWL
jgi:hypothetical protein